MKMSLIIVATFAIAMVMRKRSAALRHWVLAAGVACAAAMPLLVVLVPSWSVPFARPAAFDQYETLSEPAVSPAAPRRQLSPNANMRAATPRAPSDSRWSRLDVPATLEMMWLAGALTGLAVLLIGLLRLSWLASRAREITAGRWRDLADEIAREYSLRRPVTLLQSDHASLLVTWGLVRPRVILPADAGAWSEARARVVLSHELAHIHRGDWIVQLSAELLRAFYWFNPLLWIACRRLRLESEHACDDEVIRRGVPGTDYAAQLIDLARALNARRHAWFPAPAMARPSSLERRVRAMLNEQRDRQSISRATRIGVLVALLAAATAVAAAQNGFASLTGRASDEHGRGVQGVTVTLANEARQSKYEVKSSADGNFEFVGLPAGEYVLGAQAIGFQDVKDAVSIAGKNLQRNVSLKIGKLQETITLKFAPDSEQDSPVRDIPNVGKGIIPAKKECVAAPEGGRIVPPRKIRDASPYYPSSLRGTWTEGTVQMEALIGIDGHVADVRLIGDAQPDFAQSAVAAVREWRFTETMLNCTPVEVTMTVTVNFRRAPSTTPPAPQP